MKYGDRGDDVRFLQHSLIVGGHDVGRAGADGILGPATWAALEAAAGQALHRDWPVPAGVLAELTLIELPLAPTAFTLVIVNALEVLERVEPDHLRQLLAHVSALDLRLEGGHGALYQGTADRALRTRWGCAEGVSVAELLFREADRAGVERRAHGWVAVPTAASAASRARAHHALAARHQTRRWGANMENDVYRGPQVGTRPNGDPIYAQRSGSLEIVRGYAAAWSAGIDLDYWGYYDPTRYYTRASWAPLTVAEQSPYQRVMVMAYQTTPAEVIGTVERAVAVWRDHYDKGRLGGLVGVGRVDPKDGQVGSVAAIEALLKRYPLTREVGLYVGNGAWGQIGVGHAGFRPLVEVVPQLRRLVGVC